MENGAKKGKWMTMSDNGRLFPNEEARKRHPQARQYSASNLAERIDELEKKIAKLQSGVTHRLGETDQRIEELKAWCHEQIEAMGRVTTAIGSHFAARKTPVGRALAAWNAIRGR